MNLNKVFIFGRLTRDPEMRQTPSGQNVGNFGVATNRVWYDKDKQKKEEVEFHNVVVWGRQAEVASKFLTKGSMVFVEGRIQTRGWNDKVTGQPRKTTEIIAEQIQLGPRPAGAGGSTFTPGTTAPQAPKQEEMPVIDIEEDNIKPEDLPF